MSKEVLMKNSINLNKRSLRIGRRLELIKLKDSLLQRRERQRRLSTKSFLTNILKSRLSLNRDNRRRE